MLIVDISTTQQQKLSPVFLLTFNLYAFFFWFLILLDRVFYFTAKRIQDRSIISLNKPKFDDQFFVDLRVLQKLWTWNCSASSASSANKKQKQFHIRSLNKTNKSTKNRSTNFPLIEGILVVTLFLLIPTYFALSPFFLDLTKFSMKQRMYMKLK